LSAAQNVGYKTGFLPRAIASSNNPTGYGFLNSGRNTMNLFEQFGATFRKTMPFDNGREFCGHQKLSDALGLSCFFANPDHSWERGLNEHTNGLLRQFFPKGTNFKIGHWSI
jgi:hypothetical protein